MNNFIAHAISQRLKNALMTPHPAHTAELFADHDCFEMPPVALYRNMLRLHAAHNILPDTFNSHHSFTSPD
jgi:hypothetical protein